jgi:type IV pilus assembly protein PilN
LNINLATKPYQDVRRVLRQWGGLALLLALCTGWLLWTAYTNWHQSREVNAKIAVLNSEIAALDHQHDQALAMVQLPANRPVLDDSKFLNGLIARKAFSWTRVFMQLEQIMPPRLHVVSIQPSLSPKNDTVEVHMSVAGTSRDAAVELVKRLEQSPSFRNARIEEESAVNPESAGKQPNTGKQPKQNPDTVQFHLTAVYVPQPIPNAATVAVSSQPVARAPGRAAEFTASGAKPSGTQAFSNKAAPTQAAETRIARAAGGPQ